LLKFNFVNDLINIDDSKIDNPIYIDSVSGMSEIVIDNGKYINIKDIFSNVDGTIGEKEYCKPDNVKSLSLKNGKIFYGKIKYIMRHFYKGYLYRIHVTNTEYVDVTEDHSIITCNNINEIINNEFKCVTPLNINNNYCIFYKNFNYKLTNILTVEKLPYTEEYVYDIEVEDTHIFFANNILVHNTDSLFLTLPCSLEKEEKTALNYIDVLQETINFGNLKNFLDIHNIKIREKEDNPLLIADFKNEYLIKSMILYSKKRYISVIIKYKKDGTRYYDIDLKGVEGKRVTNKFVKILVNNLIEYIKKLENKDNIYNRFDILYKIIIPYISEFYKIDTNNIYDVLDYFSLPVNVGKQIETLKNVAGYYKGTINFDITTGENFWVGRTGKGKWLSVVIKDESYIPQILKRYEEFPQIKIKNKKPKDLIKDITIPDEYLQKESELIDEIFTVFEINYDYYIELLLKKIKLMYNPFDPVMCDNLLKKIRNDCPNDFMIFSEDYIYCK